MVATRGRGDDAGMRLLALLVVVSAVFLARAGAAVI